MAETQPSDSAAHMGKPERTNRTVGKMLVLFALGVLLLLLLGGSLAFWWVMQRPKPPVQVASLVTDYQEGAPAAGWQYLWNVGPIGVTNSYRSLVWNGSSYGPDDNSQFPRPYPGRYVKLSRRGGHPGAGIKQGSTNEVYAIAAFTFTNSGWFGITNSHLGRTEADREGEVVLRVFVNERLMGPELVCNTKAGRSFDRELGLLKGGDTLYVAVGPNEHDRYDHFDWDFSIFRSDRRK